MHDFIEQGCDSGIMVITGDPGCGKSALMGRFAEQADHKHPDWIIIPHFVGASPDSTNLRRTLRRWCTELNNAIGGDLEVPEDIRELLNLFPVLLSEAAEQKNILLIVDAVNQFEKADNPQEIRWIPHSVPENVCFVVSTLPGDALDALQARRMVPTILELPGLDESEIRHMVSEYLQEIRHDFPNEQIEQAFFAKLKHGNPLYILVALEELRVFGQFEELGDRINDLPETVPELFDQVLERIESDFNEPLVRDATSFIACGRQGMTAEELQTLLKAHAPQKETDPNEPEKLPDMLWRRLYIAFQAYLFERSGVIDYFHGQLKEAVGKRYLSEESDRNACHKTIADYFEERWREPYYRALDELPHQLIKAKNWDYVVDILSSIRFISTKCANGMSYDLLNDITISLSVLPGAEQLEKLKRIRKNRLMKYGEDLVSYAMDDNGQKPPPTFPETDREFCSGEHFASESNESEYIMILKAFEHFVSIEAERLNEFGAVPGVCAQQAANYDYAGSIHQEGMKYLKERNLPAFLIYSNSKQEKWKEPAQKRIFNHDDKVTCVAAAFASGKVVSGSRDRTVRIWDIDSGMCDRVLEVPQAIVDIAVTPDGSLVVSAEGGKNVHSAHPLKFWYMKTGECIAELWDETHRLDSVAITPDARLAIATYRGLFQVWDLRRQECLLSKKSNHDSWLTSVSISPDGKKGAFLHIADDVVVEVWDLHTGTIIRDTILKSYIHDLRLMLDYSQGYGHDIHLSVDGTKLVAGEGMQTWLFESDKKPKRKRKGRHANFAITPFGFAAVPSDRESEIDILLEGDTKSFNILKGHTGRVTSLCAYPDGQTIVSGSTDQTVRVWSIDGLSRSLPTAYDNDRNINPICEFFSSVAGQQAVSIKNPTWIGDSYYPVGTTCWDLEPEGLGKPIKNFGGPVLDLALTHDCNRAIIRTGRADRSANRTYRLDGGGQLKRDQTHVEVWCLHKKRMLKCCPIGKAGLSTIKLTSSERGILIGTNQSTTTYIDLLDAESLHSIPFVPDVEGVSGSFSVAPDDQLVIVGGTVDADCQEPGRPTIYRVISVDPNLSCILAPIGKMRRNAYSNCPIGLKDLVKFRNIKTASGQYLSEVNKLETTPDGRLFLATAPSEPVEIWSARQNKVIGCCGGDGVARKGIATTMDGNRMLTIDGDHVMRLWDLRTLDLVAVHNQTTNSIPMVWPDGNWYAINMDRFISRMKSINVTSGPPIVTAGTKWLFGKPSIRLWPFRTITGIVSLIRKLKHDYSCRDFFLDPERDSCEGELCFLIKGLWSSVVNRFEWQGHWENPHLKGRIGKWEDHLGATCPWCRNRSGVSQSMLDTIEGIRGNSRLEDGQSPCLHLPDEAWEEPKLLSECPECGGKLKFNPFIVDNRDIY